MPIPNYKKELLFNIEKDIQPKKPTFNEIFELPANKKKAVKAPKKGKSKGNKGNRPYKKRSNK